MARKSNAVDVGSYKQPEKPKDEFGFSHGFDKFEYGYGIFNKL
jgi:hypothetical protein